MNDDNEYRGWWWLPENSKDSIPGILKKDIDQNYVLQLLGNFKSYNYLLNEINSKNNYIPIINGYAKPNLKGNDTNFSLINCHIHGFNKSDLEEATYSPDIVGDTIHFKTNNELKFQTIFLKFQFIDEWLNKTGFVFSNTDNKTDIEFECSYKQPEPITLYTCSKFTMYLYFRFRYKYFVRENLDSEQSVFLNIEFRNKQNIISIQKYLQQIRYFFSLALSIPINIERFDTQIHSSKFQKRKKIKHQHTVNFQFKEKKNYFQYEDYSKYNMILTYDNISDNSKMIFDNWFKKYYLLEPVLKYFFETIYNYQLYPRNKFLNFVSALEIYHRLRLSDTLIKDSKDQKKLVKILTQIKSDNDKDWLRARIEKRNDLHFRKRIADILKDNSKAIKGLIKNKSVFINKVVITRNYYVHYERKNIKKTNIIENDFEINIYNQKLRILLQAILLKELGLDSKFINESIQKPIQNIIYYNN